MKKHTFFVLALAALCVFAFAAVAGAKYAGAFSTGGIVVMNSNGTTNTAETSRLAGYLSWDGANAVYKSVNGTDEAQTSAHGGYTTTTTKCVVCHSAHRAAGATDDEGAIVDNHLTAGGSTCLNCHGTFTAGGANTKVEYSADAANQDPHEGDCSTCHRGGIHGRGTSEYYMMDAWMLGGQSDATIAADLAAGNWMAGENWTDRANVNGYVTPDNIESLIGQPLPEDSQYAAGDVTMANADASTSYGQWYLNGDGRYTDGTPHPVQVATATTSEKPAAVGDAAYAAAKAMATGYTCGQTRCHTNSHFAVNKWGFSADRATREKVPDGTPQPVVAMTGHATGAWQHAGGSPSCSPCHPDGAAGGYRLQASGGSFGTGWGDSEAGLAPRTASAFGCDQCHDMVGKATNSTAFPHATDGITVYEWNGGVGDSKANNATREEKELVADGSNNLWMYSYFIGTPTDGSATTSWEGTFDMTQEANGPTAESATAPDRNLVQSGDPTYWQGEFRVIENLVGGLDDPSTATLSGKGTDMMCLKCHVPTDKGSITSAPSADANTVALNPGGASSHHHYYLDKNGDLATIPETGNSWNIGAGETTDEDWVDGGPNDPFAGGQEEYVGHSQLIFLFK